MEGFFSFGMNPVSNGPHSKQGDQRTLEAEVAGGGRELRAGDGGVLARRHPGAGRQEARGRADRSVPAAGGELRREGRLVRQLGALDSVEVEGGRSAGRSQARPGDHRAHLPEGSRALRTRGRPLSRAGSRAQLVVLESGEPVARRSGEGDQRLGDRRGPRREDGRGHAASAASSSRGRSTRAPTAPRCRATGSTSACTPTPAISRSVDRLPIRAAWAGYPEWAFSWPANRRILYNRCSADAAGKPWDASRPACRGAANDGSATCPISRSTARPRPVSARS